MNKKKTAIIVLVIVLSAAFGLTNYLKKLTNDALEMRTQFDEFTTHAEFVLAMEDSLQNPKFRKKVLDTVSTIHDLNFLIKQNREEKDRLVPELERLELRKSQIESKANFWNGIASILEILVVLAAIGAIYFLATGKK